MKNQRSIVNFHVYSIFPHEIQKITNKIHNQLKLTSKFMDEKDANKLR